MFTSGIQDFLVSLTIENPKTDAKSTQIPPLKKVLKFWHLHLHLLQLALSVGQRLYASISLFQEQIS